MLGLYPTNTRDKVALRLQIKQEALLIWDLVKDMEDVYYDIKHFYDFYRGRRSETGYC